MLSKESRWLEISVEADRGSVDDLVGFMGRYCQGGAVVEEICPEIGEKPNARVTVKGFLPVWDQETCRKLEVALLLLGKNSPISEPRIKTLEPEDWAESWKAFFPPQQIGAHTVIVPTWHTYEPREGDIIIHLDPGMAFGTGLHATTRLCLIALERMARPGMRVLDVGTGSGILSIAAALQGITDIDAIDVDPVAVEVARQNVTLNKVEDRVRVAHGTLGGSLAPEVPIHAGTGYDLLLVNILAEIIIEMANGIVKALAKGGTLIASGIIQEKAEAVSRALVSAGLVVDERLQEDDWVALIAHKL